MVRLSLDLTVTYAIGSDPAPGADSGARLTAGGSGSATAKANEAYIVVLIPSQSGPFGPQPFASKTRDELLEAIRDLDIDEEDIEISNSLLGGPVIVSVELSIDELTDKGEEVIDAVEEVVGNSQSHGAWFSHSNCAAVLDEAREQAIEDAHRNAEALAAAAGFELGDLAALTESQTQPSPYGPRQNPCSDDLSTVIGVGGPYGAGLVALDAEPEITVATTVTVTYSISNP
ncbi:MAG: DUF541 domain-containing protein [Dehalococcoidia bacterium]|nr:DUF541 domain-containing protein [Dehalococcoidia bacterium]